MHPQRSLVIQGSFPAGSPRVLLPAGRPGQPARPVAQPAGSSHVTPLDPTRLNLGGSGGSALPEPVQRKMETFFKTDFSDVRVHVGPQAPSIGALAFTLGSNIYFAPGQYNPQSVHGQQLLGHELAHVLQQRAGRVRNPQGSGVAVVQDTHLEAEADRMGRQAAAQPMMPVGGAAPQRPGMVQAKPAASLPGARPVAPHVQAALAAVGQPKAAWTPPVTRPAVQPKAGGHKLVVGTYLHRGPGAASLPVEAAGHTFVAVEGPGGRRDAYGFSPADPQRYDFQKDVGKLRAGVPGAVQCDDRAFAKPGVKTRTYDVSPEQARAALAKVAEYKTHPPAFSLARQDCGRFATEVLKAAKIDEFAGPGVKRPAEMYRHVQAPMASGAQAKTPSLTAAGQRPIARHVQAAVSAVGQRKQTPGGPRGRAPAPHVRNTVMAVGKPGGGVAQCVQEAGQTLASGETIDPVESGNAREGLAGNRGSGEQGGASGDQLIERIQQLLATISKWALPVEGSRAKWRDRIDNIGNRLADIATPSGYVPSVLLRGQSEKVTTIIVAESMGVIGISAALAGLLRVLAELRDKGWRLREMPKRQVVAYLADMVGSFMGIISAIPRTRLQNVQGIVADGTWVLSSGLWRGVEREEAEAEGGGTWAGGLWIRYQVNPAVQGWTWRQIAVNCQMWARQITTVVACIETGNVIYGLGGSGSESGSSSNACEGLALTDLIGLIGTGVASVLMVASWILGAVNK